MHNKTIQNIELANSLTILSCSEINTVAGGISPYTKKWQEFAWHLTLIGGLAKTYGYLIDYFVLEMNDDTFSHMGLIYNSIRKGDRKSTRLNSSHTDISRMPSSA